MADSDATPDAAADPVEDTPPAADTGDTAQNTPAPQQPIDWEARYKAAQADLTRRAQENVALRRQVEDAQSVPDDEPDDEGSPAPQARPRASERERALADRNAMLERQIAHGVYGDEVVNAYDEWVDLWNGTETESDRVTALLAFADKVRGTASQPAAAAAPSGLPSRQDAVQPRVDQNRSDAVTPDDLDPTRYAGGANGGAKGFFMKQLEKLTPS